LSWHVVFLQSISIKRSGRPVAFRQLALRATVIPGPLDLDLGGDTSRLLLEVVERRR